MNTDQILDYLSLRMPVTWVVSSEPARIADQIATASKSRPTYRYDLLEGLLVYDNDISNWVNVLTEDEESGIFLKIMDRNDAFLWLLNESEDGICIMQVVPDAVDGLIDVFYSTFSKYRRAFMEDSVDTLPAQFVIITYGDNVHPALGRIASKVTHDLPDRKEIESLIEHFKSGGLTFEDTNHENVKSALGLSENEIISAVLVHAKQNEGVVSAPQIRSKKREILKDSGILDVRTPSLNLEDLGGLDEAKKLIASISWMWHHPDEAKALSLDPLRRLLMVGVPGVGKSLFCEAIATALKVDLGKGGVSASMNKYIGESESNMRRTFATLRQMAPVVFWIDEFGRDMSGSGSSSMSDGGTTARVHGEFLTGLQELPDNVFLAAAANRIEDLPPEMLRADRFDRIMFVGFPTVEEREEIFSLHLGESRGDFEVSTLAEATPYFTGAEIKSLIKEVRFEISAQHRRVPTTAEMIDYIPQIRGRVWVNRREAITEMYQRAAVEWHWASSKQMQEAEQVLRDAKRPIKESIGRAKLASRTPEIDKAMKFGKSKPVSENEGAPAHV